MLYSQSNSDKKKIFTKSLLETPKNITPFNEQQSDAAFIYNGSKIIIKKQFTFEIIKKVLKKILVTMFLSIIFYLQFFHFDSLIKLEMEMTNDVFYNNLATKESTIYDIIRFFNSFGLIFPHLLIAFMICIYHKEQVNINLMICNFLIYSNIGVFFNIIFKNERPFWTINIYQIEPKMCKRSYGNPDMFLFNCIGFAYYIFTILRKLKIHLIAVILIFIILIFLNILCFIYFYIDGQIFLTQYFLMFGLVFAAVYLLKIIKKPLEDLFEGISISKSKNKTNRFSVIVILLILVFFFIYIYFNDMDNDRHIHCITNVLECYAFKQNKEFGVYFWPNNSIDKVIGSYPSLFYSQGIFCVISFCLSLFFSNFVIKKNKFWYSNYKPLLFMKIIATYIILISSLGTLN